MPNFLVEETTVRHSGESPVLFLGEGAKCPLLLTLSISHVVERQNLDVEVLASEDGVIWSMEPIARFLQKFCCGRYDMVVPDTTARYLKALWNVSRWGSGAHRPLCRFSLAVTDARQLSQMARVMAGAA